MDTDSENKINKFDEYKLFVRDTANFSERRQTVANIYVAVNSLLLSATAFLVKDGELENRLVMLTSILILLAGIAICILWAQIIMKYKKLIGLRMQELKKMERAPEMAGCHQMYLREDELYDPVGEKRTFLSFSNMEVRLPFVFMILYSIFLVGILFSLIWNRIAPIFQS